MRARGVLGRSATGDAGAIATDSVAASICRGVRRQNAIESPSSCRRVEMARPSSLPGKI